MSMEPTGKTRNELDDREGVGIPPLLVLNFLLRNRRLLIGLPFIAMLVTALVGFFTPRTYTSSALFAPQTSGSRRNAGLQGLAAQFGLSIGDSEAAASPAFYAELVRTYDILEAVALTEFTTEGANARRGSKLVDIYDRVYEFDAPTEAARLDATVRTLRGNVQSNAARETGLVSLSATSRSPELARQIADRILQLLNEFNVERRQSQARAERVFVQGRLKAAQTDLERAEAALRTFLQRNRNFSGSPELRLEFERLERESAAKHQFVSSLQQSFEQARIDEVRDIPVITVLQQPKRPIRPDPRGLVRKGILAGLVGFTIAVLIALIKDVVRPTRRGNSDYDQFARLRAEAVADLRQPWRVLRPTVRAGGK